MSTALGNRREARSSCSRTTTEVSFELAFVLALQGPNYDPLSFVISFSASFATVDAPYPQSAVSSWFSVDAASTAPINSGDHARFGIRWINVRLSRAAL